MIEGTHLPKEFVVETKTPCPFGLEPDVLTYTFEGIDEIQYLHVSPWTAIQMHDHDNQWEVWLRLSHKAAYVCPKGEEHELVNNSSTAITLMTIKRHLDYSYDDIAAVFYRFGFSITHGSLIIND